MSPLPILGWLAHVASAQPDTDPVPRAEDLIRNGIQNAPSEADLWEAYCGAQSATPFRQPGLPQGGTHRRVFTVCVDTTTGTPVVSPSPMNRYTHELSFQRPEILLRSRLGQPVSVVADGVPALGEGKPRSARELLDEAQDIVDHAKAEDPSKAPQAEQATSTLESQKPLAEQGVLDGAALRDVSRAMGTDSAAGKELDRLADEADDLAYGVQYLPTFGEGTLPLKVSVAPVNGSAVADSLDALVAELTDSKWSEAAQWTARFARVSADLRKRDDLSADWVSARARTTDEARRIAQEQRRAAAAAVGPTAQQLEEIWAPVREKLVALESAVVHADPAPSTSYSLQVEGFYNVTFFGGLGFAFGDARDGQWDVSSTDEVDVIVSDGTGPVDPELVIGSTVFLGRKPRTYTGLDFGFSAGVGVLGASDEGLSSFHSLYLGPTVGWIPLSLTFGPVIKTGTHLRDTRAVGQQVPTGSKVDDFVEDRAGIGWGLMVSLPWAKVEVGKNEKQDLPPDQTPPAKGVSP